MIRALALLIFAMFAIAAWLASEREVEERQRILITNAATPANPPQERRLFAICPTAPWGAPPRKQGVQQV